MTQQNNQTSSVAQNEKPIPQQDEPQQVGAPTSAETQSTDETVKNELTMEQLQANELNLVCENSVLIEACECI